MQKLFGTDGIRGLADAFPLDHSTVEKIGSSLARIFAEKHSNPARFVIGRDTRESGERLEHAFAFGAASQGAEIESAGVTTTPGVAYLTRAFKFDAGIVISASHNPYQDNGIKVFLPSGAKLDESSERLIEQDVAEGISHSDTGRSRELDRSRTDEFRLSYEQHLTSRFPQLNLEGRKIVLDCANGAASRIAPETFRRFGAEIITLNDRPDGRNINHNCGSLHLDELQYRTRTEKADFGIAFDGDADRALLVDHDGKVVDGDAILWIISWFFQNRGGLANKTVVATVMSNIGLELALISRGLKLIRAAVGDKYVLEELLRSGSEIGGEQSGHIILPKESLVGDGIVSSLFVAAAMQDAAADLSDLTNGFVRYPQTLVNVRVREKRPFDSVAEIAAASSGVENELKGRGRLLLRYSGTENLARVMIEGEDQQTIETQAKRLADVISSSLG